MRFGTVNELRDLIHKIKVEFDVLIINFIGRYCRDD